MGDRALVVFVNGTDVSPAVYLHWHGEDVPELLQMTQGLMAGDPDGANILRDRCSDPEYCAARFIGTCAQVVHGHMGLGVQLIDSELESAVRTFGRTSATAQARLSAVRVFNEQAEGYGLDAGLVVVDVRLAVWCWRAFGGHLEEHGRSGVRFEVVGPNLTAITSDRRTLFAGEHSDRGAFVALVEHADGSPTYVAAVVGREVMPLEALGAEMAEAVVDATAQILARLTPPQPDAGDLAAS